jgi:uncharacterized protein (TIGR02996 family)
MNDREALLSAIYDQPDEDTPRLMYADWLDEHGHPERAEFIRLQCERARIGELLPGERELELQKQHPEWQLPMKQKIVESPIGEMITPLFFRRGFADAVITSAYNFHRHARALFQAHSTLTKGTINGTRTQLLRALSYSTPFRLQEISVSPPEFTTPDEDVLQDDDMTLVGRSRSLQRARALTIMGSMMHGVSDDGAEQLASAADLPQLEELSFVMGDHIGERGVMALADAAGLPALKKLHVHNLHDALHARLQGLIRKGLQLTKAKSA